MTAVIGLNEVGVKAFGKETTIPNSATAKLMYYMHCICTVLPIEKNG